MEKGAGMWRVIKAGTGVGVQQRFAQVILGRPGPRAIRKAGILQQFLDSTSAAVSMFGPVWAKQEIGGRPLGGWLLVCCWLVVPVLLAFVLVKFG